MSNTGQPQNRLSIDEVPDQISRIFFGKGIQSGRPNYASSYQPPSPGYGVPQGPVLSDNGFFPGSSLYLGKYWSNC